LVTAAPGTLPAEQGDREQRPDRLRLAVATARYPPLTGGIELHVEEVCRRHAALGVDVTGRLPETERFDGVEIARLSAWPSHRGYYFSAGIYNRIVGGDSDLLHVQGFQTLVAVVGRRRRGHTHHDH
jgi:hypothetical protein